MDAGHGACGPEPAEQIPGPTGGEASQVLSGRGGYQLLTRLCTGRLHLHNPSLRQQAARVGKEGAGYVEQFGFECTTCCGFIPLTNDWNRDWVVSQDCGFDWVRHYGAVIVCRMSVSIIKF